VSKEQHDEACSRLTGGRGLESLGDWPTVGMPGEPRLAPLHNFVK